MVSSGWDGYAAGPDETSGFGRARSEVPPAASGGWGDAPASDAPAEGGWGQSGDWGKSAQDTGAQQSSGGWGAEDTTPNNNADSGGWGAPAADTQPQEQSGWGQDSTPADSGWGNSGGNDQSWGNNYNSSADAGNDGDGNNYGGNDGDEWAASGLTEEEQRKVDCDDGKWWNWDRKTDDKTGFEYYEHPFEPGNKRFANGNEWVDWETEQGKGATIESRGNYMPHESIANMPKAEVDAYREEKRIMIKAYEGDSPPNPITSFDYSGLPEYVVEACVNDGFEAPTPIQSQCWPIILSGRDIVGVSQTGSGKTLAYLGPLTVHICAQEGLLEEGDGPIGLILSPTRELVVQIKQQIDKFASTTGIISAALFGGKNQREQEKDVKMQYRKFQCEGLSSWSPPEVVVASVGRLRDFIDKGHTNLRNVTYFVMDEADNLLGDGWKDDITAFRQSMRPEAQTLLFTATYSDPTNRDGDTIRDYAKVLCRHEPVHVYIGEDELVPCNDVDQRFKQHPGWRAERTEVASMVAEIIKEVEADDELMKIYDFAPKFIVFCNSRNEIDELCDVLREVGVGALSLHGQMEQQDRERNMEYFRTDQYTKVLVGTDLLSRGLDLPDVACVVLTNLPNDASNYVHRIGRTGRAGKKGVSYAFINPDGKEDWIIKDGSLQAILKQADMDIPDIISGGNAGGGSSYWGQNERTEDDTVNKENEDAADARDSWNSKSWGDKKEESWGQGNDSWGQQKSNDWGSSWGN